MPEPVNVHGRPTEAELISFTAQPEATPLATPVFQPMTPRIGSRCRNIWICHKISNRVKVLFRRRWSSES
jgi:hypothetical protein